MPIPGPEGLAHSSLLQYLGLPLDTICKLQLIQMQQCVMALLHDSSDDEEEPVPGASNRDYGEHQKEVEGSGRFGWSRWGHPGNVKERGREQPDEQLAMQDGDEA